MPPAYNGSLESCSFDSTFTQCASALPPLASIVKACRDGPAQLQSVRPGLASTTWLPSNVADMGMEPLNAGQGMQLTHRQRREGTDCIVKDAASGQTEPDGARKRVCRFPRQSRQLCDEACRMELSQVCTALDSSSWLLHALAAEPMAASQSEGPCRRSPGALQTPVL